MKIAAKIERIKIEIKFLIQGEGTIEEKQAALSAIAGPYIDDLMAAEAAKQQPAE